MKRLGRNGRDRSISSISEAISKRWSKGNGTLKRRGSLDVSLSRKKRKNCSNPRVALAAAGCGGRKRGAINQPVRMTDCAMSWMSGCLSWRTSGHARPRPSHSINENCVETARGPWIAIEHEISFRGRERERERGEAEERKEDGKRIGERGRRRILCFDREFALANKTRSDRSCLAKLILLFFSFPPSLSRSFFPFFLYFITIYYFISLLYLFTFFFTLGDIPWKNFFSISLQKRGNSFFEISSSI